MCVHAWPETEEEKGRLAQLVHGCLKCQVCSSVKMCFYSKCSPNVVKVLKWVLLVVYCLYLLHCSSSVAMYLLFPLKTNLMKMSITSFGQISKLV